jgi:elongation factor P
MNVTELRPGNYFEDEGNLFQVIDILLNKTAMRKMVAKVKVKNIRTGAVIEIARNSGYDVELVSINKRTMQYLYDSGTTLVFMDPKTYDQIELPKQNLENEIPYLAPNGEVIPCFLRRRDPRH